MNYSTIRCLYAISSYGIVMIGQLGPLGRPHPPEPDQRVQLVSSADQILVLAVIVRRVQRLVQRANRHVTLEKNKNALGNRWEPFLKC